MTDKTMSVTLEEVENIVSQIPASMLGLDSGLKYVPSAEGGIIAYPAALAAVVEGADKTKYQADPMALKREAERRVADVLSMVTLMNMAQAEAAGTVPEEIEKVFKQASSWKNETMSTAAVLADKLVKDFTEDTYWPKASDDVVKFGATYTG